MLTGPGDRAAGETECAAVRAEIFAACDGELTPRQREAFDAHLTACASCRGALTSDATFHAAVRRAVSIDTAPPSLRERVMQHLQSTVTETAGT
jgi:mycothiol system anti-sigma-R factor